MKFTLNWLKNHLDTTATLDDITRTLTAIGLEVEAIANPAEALASFTVAEIIEATQHPDADKLRVCKVKSDAGELQIVCGAPNARAGIKVALAKVGALIPNGGFTIKQSKIRGVESCGMLCSADELNLGGDSAGILELPLDAPIGAPIAEVLGLNDATIEINITPNRGDCLGVYGIARDLAAAGMGTLKHLPALTFSPYGPCPVAVSLATNHCKQFVACHIKGVKNGDSPEWLQQRLKAIGLRPISALVDITNFITFALARPLHVYDAAKLKGNLVVRDAKAGETFDALNDKSYEMRGGECVITDDSGVLGLGGIVGGTSTSVDASTKDVLLECAWFEPEHIAHSGRKHEVLSDARYRFERGVDPLFLEHGAAIALNMILEICGGTPSVFAISGTPAYSRVTIAVKADAVATLGGVKMDVPAQKTILETLGFVVSPKGDDMQVTVPSWRPDVTQEADIVEELLRIYGYDRVEAVSLPKPPVVAQGAWNPAQSRLAIARRTLAARGLHEAHSWAFLSPEMAALFGGGAEELTLKNPISADLSVMRPSLLPHLVQALARNAARGFANLALFEVGPQFKDTSPAGQQSVACAVRMGEASTKQWDVAARAVDCFDAKADALAALAAAGVAVEKLQVMKNTPEYYHPGRSGALTLGPKNILAYFGELHPATLEALGCDARVVACEVMLDAIPTAKPKANNALQRSDYQPVDRDFAFVVDASTPADDLLRAAAGADKQLVQSVHLFDVYAGKGVEDGKKSLAITLRLQATDRTLTEADIEGVSQKVVAAAAKLGGTLRG